MAETYTETHTYDEETGYLVTSVCPVTEESVHQEQALRITEELEHLMQEHCHSENRRQG